ncbi:MAG: elongation factor Ts, partial [Acidimicrobiia bacterium]
AQAVNEGKPENIVERIVEGRINSFYQDNVLYDQVFIKTEVFDGTVDELVKQLAAKMGENIGITHMSRVAVGEEG